MLDIFKLKFLYGYRTKIIATLMILAGVGKVAAALLDYFNGHSIGIAYQEGVTLIGTGIGLLTAAAHKPAKPE